MNPWESYHTTDEPLFRVGRVPVYVTTLMVALQVIAMVGIAVIGFGSPLIAQLVFSSAAIQSGKLWTLVTYAFVDYLNFWSALSLVFFYLFGLRVEMRLGTRRYLRLLGILIVGPTIFLALLGLIADPFGGSVYTSSTNVRLCVLIAFVWFNSQALFWPGIQAKWVGVIFVALSTLQYLGARQWVFFWMCWFSLLLAYVTLRRMGLERKFATIEDGLLNLIPERKSKGYRSSQRKLKVVKKGKGGRRVQYESKLAPKVEAMASAGPVASVDHLLEKISKEGISSLTEEERKQLESASRKLESASKHLSGKDGPSS